MAQNRSKQPHSPGPGGQAQPLGVTLRFGRAARDALGRPANDNRASLLHRTIVAMVQAAFVGAAAYAVWRWIG